MNLVRITIVLLFLFVLCSCKNPFNPPIESSKPGNSLALPNTSPENVLRNLVTAYNYKSLEIYKATLDKDFLFYVVTQDAPEIGTNFWGYEQEIEFHRNLFSAGSSRGDYIPPNNIFLNLVIPQPENWSMNSQIGKEDWVIISCSFHLTLNYSIRPDITANGFARYYLKPVGNEWFIALWQDESNI